MKQSASTGRGRVLRAGIPMVALLVVLTIAVTTVVFIPKQHVHAVGSPADWPTYFANNARTGYNPAETAINATTAPNLKVHWTYATGGTISTQSVVINGVVYTGSWDGYEYATDLMGQKLWSTFISPPTPDCQNSRIFGVGSIATVATVPIQGTMTSVVYVGSSNAQLYALNATDGTVIWQTSLSSVAHTFLWSNAAYYNGSLYIGISSVSDCPLVQGGLAQVNASTGAIQHVFYVVPNGCLGGSIWSSPAIDEAAGKIYVTTGNRGSCSTKEMYTEALVKLNASDLSVLDSWQVPKSQQVSDSDFGATPTLFTATIGGVQQMMVGMENKNGIFYALNRTSLQSGPVWQTTIGPGRLNMVSAAFDGTNLYVGSRKTTINGTQCSGSLRALNPATGAFVWQDCLKAVVYTGVSAVPGVVFVGTGARLEALASNTGNLLFSSKLSDAIYGSPSISNGTVYIGDKLGTLYAFGL